MKTLKALWLLSLAAGLAACNTTGHKGGGTARVEFVHPEKYTDIKLRDTPDERAREILLPDLERYIQKQARIYIRAGEQLTLNITDIDEPGWLQTSGAFPKRTVRSVQPGRVDFEYNLRNSSGQVIREGKETLSDLPWDRTDQSFENEQMPLTKQMLRNWIRKIGRSATA